MASRALKAGGRYVTLPVNPDVHTDPEHSAHYGFRLSADRPLGDADALTLELCPPGHRALITARYWSRPTIDAALRASGFSSIVWHKPTVSAEGTAALGTDYWRNDLTTPHAMVVEARK